jgi:hypothetical protein
MPRPAPNSTRAREMISFTWGVKHGSLVEMSEASEEASVDETSNEVDGRDVLEDEDMEEAAEYGLPL